jgi:hypothetical protein
VTDGRARAPVRGSADLCNPATPGFACSSGLSESPHGVGVWAPQFQRSVRFCVIDGEAIVTNDQGLAVSDLIRHRRHHVAAEQGAFDLIELEGEDQRHVRIEERKRALARLLGRYQAGIIVNEYFEGDGAIGRTPSDPGSCPHPPSYGRRYWKMARCESPRRKHPAISFNILA